MGDKIKIVPHTEVFADSEIVMRVIGYNHYKLSDGSGEFAGVVFDMVGVMNSGYAMMDSRTNAGGYSASNIREYLNDIVYPELPQRWRTLIKEVEVLSNIGNTLPDITVTYEKIFPISMIELMATSNFVPYNKEVDSNAEDLTFDAYTDNKSRIKCHYNGEGNAAVYWTRSASSGNNVTFCICLHTGIVMEGNETGYPATSNQYISWLCCM